ncbi:choline dehydrogenase, mitochondrial isoform X4 [Hydra vulgaris]|uniref:Choline dehydrogenase, mitochondrial isoform X4 n=1 Tax=Hydra vulgaris TaxID=6087 RepID=A0ABM4BEQ5_HYDVU
MLSRNRFRRSASIRNIFHRYLTWSTSHDYVIVGAGSAGCVLANRLSENPNNSVLSLEAGPQDAWWNWKIHMPGALPFNLQNDKFNWYYHTEPQSHMYNRVIYWPRGRVWGGSSALNAMMYVRGHPQDFDRWENEGAKGWSYKDCLPYFKKPEGYSLGEDQYRGGNGPLLVSGGSIENPLGQAFLEAGQQAGYPYTEDFNGYQQEGMGKYDRTIYKGKRWSTSQAYLHPALKRKNLDAQHGAFTTKILFEGSKAIGVEYVQNSVIRKAKANKEVILSGGAVNTPQLMMLSGIGDKEELARHGINCVAHVPGVGKNLQDHLGVYIQHRCIQPVSLYKHKKPWRMPFDFAMWLLNKTGICSTNSMDVGAFIRSQEKLPHPDIQLIFFSYAISAHGKKEEEGHSYQVVAETLRATSCGYIALKSADPRDHPLINPNYLATQKDVVDMRESVKLAREIFSQDALKPFRGEELQPGLKVKTDAEIDKFVRERAETIYHPCCSCKMGHENDPMAVVDNQTRVFGIENLRIVDASIMPSNVSGNLNAPVMMMAEKAADVILGKKPLPQITVPVYETLATSQ